MTSQEIVDVWDEKKKCSILSDLTPEQFVLRWVNYHLSASNIWVLYFFNCMPLTCKIIYLCFLFLKKGRKTD